MMSTLALVMCLGGLAVCLWGTRQGQLPVHASGKVVATLGFLAFAAALGVYGRSPHGTTFLIAFVLCAIGDVALIGKSKPAFLGGLTAFLLGHVGYIVVFLQLGFDPTGVVPGAVFMTLLAAYVLRRLREPAGKLFPAVVAYVAVIGVMVALAGGVAVAHPGLHGGVLAAAAVVFAISDLFVARQRFLAEEFINRLVGLPLYYGAQLLFAFGAVGLGTAGG